jgi:hypothetical protein
MVPEEFQSQPFCEITRGCAGFFLTDSFCVCR